MSLHLPQNTNKLISDGIRGLKDVLGVAVNVNKIREHANTVKGGYRTKDGVKIVVGSVKCLGCGNDAYYELYDLYQLAGEYIPSLGTCPNKKCTHKHIPQNLQYRGVSVRKK
jgi:hypothetical protein